MTNTLAVKPGDKVLEIGTGSGYQSAYLSYLTDRLWSIEIIPALAKRTRGVYDSLIARGYSRICGDPDPERRRLLRLAGGGAVRQDHRHLRHRPHPAAAAATAQARRDHGHSGRPARRAARGQGGQGGRPPTASPCRAPTSTTARSSRSCRSPAATRADAYPSPARGRRWRDAPDEGSSRARRLSLTPPCRSARRSPPSPPSPARPRTPRAASA